MDKNKITVDGDVIKMGGKIVGVVTINDCRRRNDFIATIEQRVIQTQPSITAMNDLRREAFDEGFAAGFAEG
tara:strand:+ start:19067 stop:19282 length:216 start_codon:yes stop_codon:yes gene_type:complete